MNRPPSVEGVRQSLRAHLAAKGAEIHRKYGPHIGWDELVELLKDPDCVRYPCEIRFDAGPLLAGELAHPAAKGKRPEEGFTLFVHPGLATQLSEVPLAALYQLVVVNYGNFVSAEDAETFGCHALGLSQDDYYQALCKLADQIDGVK